MAERTFQLLIPPDMPAPRVQAALAGPVADLIKAAWGEEAADHKASGQYLAGLETRDSLAYPYHGDADAMAVINTDPKASLLEDGHAAFSLAEHWGRGGGKWKVSKKGTLYATVPFRHSTPTAAGGGSSSMRRRTAMPVDIAARAGGLLHKGRLTGLGDLYKQGKLDSKYVWKSSPFESMVHTNMPTPQGGHQAEYTTFRTITPDSEGWQMPAMPGFHFSERALDRAAPAIADLLEGAAAQDAMDMVLDAVGGLL